MLANRIEYRPMTGSVSLNFHIYSVLFNSLTINLPTCSIASDGWISGTEKLESAVNPAICKLSASEKFRLKTKSRKLSSCCYLELYQTAKWLNAFSVPMPLTQITMKLIGQPRNVCSLHIYYLLWKKKYGQDMEQGGKSCQRRETGY